MNAGEIAERLRRSVVHIRRAGRGGASAGTGIVWSEDGAILTNAHVVEGAGEVNVEYWDGRIGAGQVESVDRLRDLARVRGQAEGLRRAEFRQGPARAGEMAVAVGNPLGFSGAMTRGVVRGTGPVRGLGKREWVQAEIRLAPGNSGGPLAGEDGRLIGINTMVVRGGMALAVPSAAVLDFALRGAAPRLGVTVQEVKLGGGRSGLVIVAIEAGSAAERASLMIGDVLTGVNGHEIGEAGDLAEAVEGGRGVVRLEFTRGGRPERREVAAAVSGGRGVGYAA